MPRLRELLSVPVGLTGLAASGLAAGGSAGLAGHAALADVLWAATTAVIVLPAIWWVVGALRRRQFGTDVIAVFALAGTLIVGEYLAGAVIALMFAGGRALEDRATGRARRDLAALASLAPRVAHRRTATGIATVDADEIQPGDPILVRPGEIVPVDGIAMSAAVLDQSMITGESLPAEIAPGGMVRSGTVNTAGPIELRTTSTAASSTYAGLVRLARDAAAETAPFVRMADRYAAFFLPIVLAVAFGAWAWSGDVVRSVAVLVVATPCPLILAAPIAYVSGMSRCARRGVIVKGGAALDALAQARTLLFDKTGTVTAGRPSVTRVISPGSVSGDEVLRLAASVDQVSSHVLATAIVAAADKRGLRLQLPQQVEEVPGAGIRGLVGTREVTVGKARLPSSDAPSWVTGTRQLAASDGLSTVFVGVNGELAGAVILHDPLRLDAMRTFRLLRRAGIERAVMITGDKPAVATPIGALVGADEVQADATPARKVDVVRRETRSGPTVMVGDGVNDAPALAAATVGVALGARGASASSEAADVVITVDRLDRVAETLLIAQRTRHIARQSALAGMGLSLIAMVVAALGWLPPVGGALVQEAIDVAVILNALRALGAGYGLRRQPALAVTPPSWSADSTRITGSCGRGSTCCP